MSFTSTTFDTFWERLGRLVYLVTALDKIEETTTKQTGDICQGLPYLEDIAKDPFEEDTDEWVEAYGKAQAEIENLTNAFRAGRNSLVSLKRAVKSSIDRLMSDAVQAWDYPDPSPVNQWSYLTKEMLAADPNELLVANDAKVNVAGGGAAYEGKGQDSGAKTTQDGYIIASTIRPHSDGTSKLTELPIAETMKVTCTKDVFGGATAGSERFTIRGTPKLPSVYHGGTRGSGAGPSFTVIHGAGTNEITNGDCENWTSSALDGWTAVDGAFGTEITQYSTTSFLSTNVVKMTAASAADTLSIKQDLTNLTANTVYGVGLWTYWNISSDDGTNTLEITLHDGDDNEVGTTDLAVADGNKLTLTTAAEATWTFHGFMFATPDTITGTPYLKIEAKMNATSDLILIDNIAMGKATEHNHVQFAAFRGNVDFVLDDEVTVVVTNNNTSIMQTQIGRLYDVQLPSGTPVTVPNSLSEIP